MSELWVAVLIWLVTHLGISSTPLRGILIRSIGQNAYLGLYSLLAAASLVYLIWIYTEVPRFDYLWLPDPDLYWVAKITMPLALILMVGGFMVPNPTMVGATLDDTEAKDLARGVTRITRHPFQWAVVIWALGHIVANGDLVSIVFFSAFGLLSFVGTFLMDAKKQASFEGAWDIYARKTSNVPFAAVLRGDNKLVMRELLGPVLAGLLAYGLLYFFHDWLTGTVVI